MMVDAGGDPDTPRPRTGPLVAAFIALVALASCELWVIGLTAGRAARITALAGLLMAKVGLVLAFFMRGRANRRASWLVLTAIGLATGAAVVLMLDTVFRVTLL